MTNVSPRDNFLGNISAVFQLTNLSLTRGGENAIFFNSFCPAVDEGTILMPASYSLSNQVLADGSADGGVHQFWTLC